MNTPGLKRDYFVLAKLMLPIVLSLFLVACGESSGTDNVGDNRPDTTVVNVDPDTTPVTVDPVLPVTVDPALPVQDGVPFIDDPRLYQSDGYGTVDVIRVDVRTRTKRGNCTEADDSGCTLDDVIADTNRKDAFTVRIPVHLISDDFPDDGQFSNATMRQRGGTTRTAAQKSFAIKLDNKNNLWRGERSLLLNKHPFEKTRIRNKLAFDLMSGIPHLRSSRTQFVNLWIDDGNGPVDYGLFTHIEAPGSNYLDKRGLSRDDNLYKAGFFRFTDDDLRNTQVDDNGKPLDRDRFEISLEIEAGEDHRKLVEMLEAMQDPTRDFDSVLDQYFDRENVLTWMTVNLLLHQTDAITHNLILYNRAGSDIFYFLPWDYDGALAEEIEPPADSFANQDLQRRLFYGYARGIKSDFHNRYYRQPGIHQKILDKADQLRRDYLTDTLISERASELLASVEPYVVRSPDVDFGSSFDPFAVAAFPQHVADNHDAIATRFSVPMPPELEEPVLEDGQWVFSWRAAFDVTGHEISYDLQVSTAIDFADENIVLLMQGIRDDAENPEVRINTLNFQPGVHYARVIARVSLDPERFWQVSENTLEQDGTTWYGVTRFEVN